MSNFFAKILWVIMGMLLIVAGAFCIVSPTVALGSLAFVIGVAMLFSGIGDIAIYAKIHDYIIGAGWILADGILTIVISIIFMFNQSIVAVTLPFVFGIWLIFRGVSQAIASFDFKKLNVSGWGWFLAFGIILMILGALAIVKPVGAAIALSVLIGVSLISQGLVTVVKGLCSKRIVH